MIKIVVKEATLTPDTSNIRVGAHLKYAAHITLSEPDVLTV